MVMPKQAASPRTRGTIASRYLEAISCGGDDGGALSVPTGPRWTPERQRHVHSRLNDSSCGQTAPTAALDVSSSWTTMETPSRSDAASRRSGAGFNRRQFPADTAYTRDGQGPFGIEDDCSSIESSSSHRESSRAAHLSIDMEDSFLDKSFEDDPRATTPVRRFQSSSGRMKPSRDHLIDRRHNSLVGNAYQPQAQWRKTGSSVFACSPGSNFFPKTQPCGSDRRPATRQASIAAPYKVRRVGTLNRNVHEENERVGERQYSFRNRKTGNRAWGTVQDDQVSSVAGAPTEVMTNLTRDVLKRNPLPPNNPPPLRRWLPPQDSTGDAAPLQSLIDEASTTEESTSHSRGPEMQRHALVDLASSSMASQSTESSSRAPAHVTSQDHTTGNPWLEKPRSFSVPNDSDSVLLGNSGESSLKAKTGTRGFGGKVQYGGRAVGAGPKNTRLSNYSSARGIHTRTAVQQAKTIQAAQQAKEIQADESNVRSPIRFYMKDDDPMSQPRTPQPASSGEVTSSVSTTDALLLPDIANGEQRTTTFIRYNARKTPNAHEVFQRRYSDSSNTSTLSTSDKTQEDGRVDAQNPIQPLFSLDRLNLSYDSHSPIRKYSSHPEAQNKPATPQTHVDEPPPKQVMLRENELQGQAQEVQKARPDIYSERFTSEQRIPGPDPIFCPAGSLSFSSKGTESAATNLSSDIPGSSKEEDTNVRRSAPVSGRVRKANLKEDIDDGFTHSRSKNREKGAAAWRQQHDNGRSMTASDSAHTPQDTSNDVATSIFVDPVIGSRSTTPKRHNSVKDRIQAFSTKKPDQRMQPAPNHTNQASPVSRQALVMGAHLASMANEEKKDDASIETPSIQAHDYYEDGADDDDLGSVKSLRDKFEQQLFPNAKSDAEKAADEDNDDSSFQSLRDKLERHLKTTDASLDDDDDDDGSVRSLREKFEGSIKKRESGLMVSHLKSLFESEKAVPTFQQKRNNAWVAAPTKFRSVKPSRPRDAEIASSDHRQNFQQTKSVFAVKSQHSKALADPDVTVNDNRMASSASANVGTRKQQANSDDRSSVASAPSTEAQIAMPAVSSEDSEPTATEKAGRIDVHIRQTNSERTERATGGPSSHLNDEDTISTHSSRVRGPAPTAFLSMKERLLKFSRSHSPKPTTSPQKKKTPPTMHQRLNRWATRQQAAKQSPLASQDENVALPPSNERVEVKRTGSYDLSTLHDVKPAEEPVPEATPGGFFNRTNPDTQEMRQVAQRGNNRRPHGGEGRNIFGSNVQGMKVEQSPEHISTEAHWVYEDSNKKPEQGRKHERVSRNDSRGKSMDTEGSDGVTLDPSIADVSMLTDPTLIRTKGSKDFDIQQDTSAADCLNAPSSSQINAAPNDVLPNAMLASASHDEANKDANQSTSHDKLPVVSPDAQSPQRGADDGWNVEQIEKSFSFQTSCSSRGAASELESHEDPFEGIEWPELTDVNWMDFSPLPQHDERRQVGIPNSETQARPERPNKHRKNTWAWSQANTRGKVNHSQNGYHPASVDGVVDDDSNLSPLPPLPSPDDEKYDIRMESRHKMLLSRQRAHLQRKLARENSRENNDVAAAPVNLQRTDYDLSDQARSPQRCGFFGRTNPASKPLPSPSISIAGRPSGILKVPSKYRSVRTEHPKKKENSYQIQSSAPPRKGNTSSGKGKTSGNQPLSLLSKIGESIGLSSGPGSSGGASRHETLVARLKSVKASRLRRHTSNRHMPAHQALQDENSDEKPLVASASQTTAATPAPLPMLNRPLREKVVSSHKPSEAIGHLVGVPPPPPPMPPHHGRTNGTVASSSSVVSRVEEGGRESPTDLFFEALLEVD